MAYTFITLLVGFSFFHIEYELSVSYSYDYFLTTAHYINSFLKLKVCSTFLLNKYKLCYVCSVLLTKIQCVYPWALNCFLNAFNHMQSRLLLKVRMFASM